MSYKLDFRFEPDYLHVQAIGVQSLANLMAIAAECQEACKKHGYRKLLIDVQGMTGEISTADVYKAGQEASEKFELRLGIKTALVDTEENRKRFAFFETVAANRGFYLRVFSEVAQAERWLRQIKDASTSSIANSTYSA